MSPTIERKYLMCFMFIVFVVHIEALRLSSSSFVQIWKLALCQNMVLMIILLDCVVQMAPSFMPGVFIYV